MIRQPWLGYQESTGAIKQKWLYTLRLARLQSHLFSGALPEYFINWRTWGDLVYSVYKCLSYRHLLCCTSPFPISVKYPAWRFSYIFYSQDLTRMLSCGKIITSSSGYCLENWKWRQTAAESKFWKARKEPVIASAQVAVWWRWFYGLPHWPAGNILFSLQVPEWRTGEKWQGCQNAMSSHQNTVFTSILAQAGQLWSITRFTAQVL